MLTRWSFRINSESVFLFFLGQCGLRAERGRASASHATFPPHQLHQRLNATTLAAGLGAGFYGLLSIMLLGV